MSAEAQTFPSSARVVAFLASIGDLCLLAGRTVREALRRPLRLSATIEQLSRQGVRGLSLATVAAVFYGMVLALQMGIGLERFGATALLGELTTLGLLRELVPVLVGLVIGSRLGAGIAAELGSMAVTEQIDAVRVLGADPVREFVAPRVVAATLVVLLVTVYSDVVAVLGAMAVATQEYRISARYFIDSSSHFVEASDFFIGLAKATVFGGAVGLLACREGMRATGGTAGVGHATTRAVVLGALSVIILDFFLSRLTLFFFSAPV